jgi:hypothetical protein
MITGTSSTYEGTPSSSTASPGDTLPDGASVVDDGTGLRYWYFWNYNLRFNPSLWDFSGVASRGYPLLTGVGGQEE